MVVGEDYELLLRLGDKRGLECVPRECPGTRLFVPPGVLATAKSLASRQLTSRRKKRKKSPPQVVQTSLL